MDPSIRSSRNSRFGKPIESAPSFWLGRSFRRILGGLFVISLAYWYFRSSSSSLSSTSTFHKQARMAEVTEASTKATSQSLVQFSFDLFSRIRAGDEPKNVFFSPFSVSAALGLVLAGSSGLTEQEILQAMHVTISEPEYHAAFSAISQKLGLDGSPKVVGADLSVANKIWTSIAIKQSYLDLTSALYAASAETANFRNDPEGERVRINKWVSDRTKSLIPDLLPDGSITSDTSSVLTNAIYFKGTWTKTFDDKMTQPNDFDLLDGSKISNVPLMYREATVRYKHSGDFQAIELPYGPRGNQALETDLSMVVILPEENTKQALDNVVTSLQGKGFAGLVDQLFEVKVKIYLPRFQLEESVDLSQILQDTGIKSAFTHADFSRMTDTSVAISKVLHKAVVKVNEEGTEAAAATAVLMKRSMALHPNPVFRADHAFVFFIWDRVSRTILFIGQCIKPTIL